MVLLLVASCASIAYAGEAVVVVEDPLGEAAIEGPLCLQDASCCCLGLELPVGQHRTSQVAAVPEHGP